MEFRKAEKRKAKLRLAITGTSGSGKTYGALLIAKGLGGKILLLERVHINRASKIIASCIIEIKIISSLS